MGIINALSKLNNGLVANDGMGDSLRTGAGTINGNSDIIVAAVNALAASQGSGVKPFATKAALVAAQAGLPAGTVAVVFADPAPANNTSYVWDGATLTTAYDRLTFALGNGSGFLSNAIGAVLRNFTNKVQETKSLLDFAGDSPVADWSVAMVAADAWAASVGGAQITVPAGDYPFATDVRLLASSTCWIGHGAKSRFRGIGNARLIVGQATPGAGTEPAKTGTKVVETHLLGLGIKPNDNHSGECLLLDYCDNTVLWRLDVGPFNNNGTTVTHGIKYNWTQYTETNQCLVNVNGYGLYVLLPYNSPENEDHFSFHACWVYTGKTINASFMPACVAFERGINRGAAIFHCEFFACHFGKFPAAGPTASNPSAGLLIVNNDTAGTDRRTFHAMSMQGCMFENVDYPIDFKSKAVANDTSAMHLSSVSFLGFQTAIQGTDISKTYATVQNCYFQNGATGVDNVRCFFDGFNRMLNVTTRCAQSYGNHRYAAKTGLSLFDTAGTVRLRNSSSQSVSGSPTSVTITHGLAGAPNMFDITPSWNTTFWVTNVGATTFQVNFGTAPTGTPVLYWTAEIRDS
jgi:hypothetical protein